MKLSRDELGVLGVMLVIALGGSLVIMGFETAPPPWAGSYGWRRLASSALGGVIGFLIWLAFTRWLGWVQSHRDHGERRPYRPHDWPCRAAGCKSGLAL